MTSKTYLAGKSYLSGLRDMSAEDLLKSIGLQSRRSALRAVLSSTAIFATGILLGAGLGMAFAPRRGEQIRREIREKAGTMKSRMGQYAEKAASKAEEVRESPTFDA